MLGLLELVFDFFFSHYIGTFNAVVSLVLLSITISVLMLPLYWYADKLQKKDSIRKSKFEDELESIKGVANKTKKHFYTQHIYKKHNYHPIQSLTSVLGVLIQVPFFIVAYRYLSSYEGFIGQSIYFFKDLSQADGAFRGINILPIGMTIINIISGLIYGMGEKKKNTLQVFLIPLLFLALLYNKGSAVVLYWTINNVFSLVKNGIIKRGAIRNTIQNTALKTKENKGRLLFVIQAKILRDFKRVGQNPAYHSIMMMVIIMLSFLTLAYSVGVVWKIDNDITVKLAKVLIGLWGMLYTLFTIQYIAYKRSRAQLQTRELSLWESFGEKILYVYVIFSWGMIGIFGSIYVLKIPVLFPYLHTLPYWVLYILIRMLVFLPCIGTWMLLSRPETRGHYIPNIRMSEKKAQLYPLMMSMLGLFAVMVLVIALKIYFSGPELFIIQFGHLFTSIIFMVMLPIVALSVVYRFAKRLRVFLCAVLYALIIVLLLYSLFPLNSALGFNGFLFDNPELLHPSNAQKMMDVGMLILVAGLFYALFVRKHIVKKSKHFTILNIVLMLSIMVQGGIAFMQADRTKFYNPENSSNTAKGMTLSSGKNIVLLYFDGFSNYLLDEVLQDNPDIWEGLDGFTWYKNTASAGSWTYLGAPGILGGEDYTPDYVIKNIVDEKTEKILEIMEKTTAEVENTFINTIKDYGARVMLYGEYGHRLLNFFEESNKNNNADFLMPYEIQSFPPFLLLQISFFRFIPFSAREGFYGDGKWQVKENTSIDLSIKEKHLRTQRLKSFTVDDDTTMVSAFIGNVTHGPFGINEKGVVSKTINDDKHPQYYTDLFVLREVIAFINKAKAEGIYNDMQIMIVSDHGWGFSCENIAKDERKLFETYDFNEMECRSDSVLLIKNSGESGRLKMNDTTFLGNFDTYPIIMHNFDDSIKDPRAMDTTNRSIIYTASYFDTPFSTTIIRMTGSALDTSRWEVLRRDEETK